MHSAKKLFGESSERGGSLVEFALIVPMMMVLLTGMYSMGLALSYYLVLTNATSVGARAFAISPAVSITSGKTTQTITDPCAYAVQMANQAAPIMASRSITYTITYTPAGGKGSTYTTGTCNNIDTNVGDTVQLQASYPYNFLLYGFKPGNLNIQARSAELVQ
jgi:Flp pilus assembly protein TadG